MVIVLLLMVPGWAEKQKKKPAEPAPPTLLLEGGRKLDFERSLSSERDIRGKRSFWAKVVDVVAGERDYKDMVRPYSVAVDSRGRLIITDPGMGGVHIFDPAQHKYKFIERKDKGKDAMLEPQCVAVDSHDNIYVTDSKVGKIFVFNSDGKYQRALGSIKGGEGFYKRPTGIAIDPETQRIYVTDTLRDRVYILDAAGEVIKSIGQRGTANGEFNFPTELLMRNGILAVVDSMNFRVQLFDANGAYQGSIGGAGDRPGFLFRPKGIAIDSEDHIYMVEGLWGEVQVFDREGRLLYNFGKRGTRAWEFQLPTGLFIDRNDRVYVVDSYNKRVQIFQYHALKSRADGAMR